jgi:murein DD-endopeptidase MepM/ murein hydrolase activator NlpD
LKGPRTNLRGLIVALLATSACIVADQPAAGTDTVHVVDTVTLVDTVRLRDTMVALGEDTVELLPGLAGPVSESELDYLRGRNLMVPVVGVPAGKLPDSFQEMRGSRLHAALDIMAPRGTPVLSADAGTVAKLHTSVGGGLTAYLFDPSERFIYYYAHLDRYHPRLKEGMRIARGDTIGFVGFTGNASPGAPHLHFAIARMGEDKRWWSGTPIDPRPIYLGEEGRE